jgi:hypothetical protein
MLKLTRQGGDAILLLVNYAPLDGAMLLGLIHSYSLLVTRHAVEMPLSCLAMALLTGVTGVAPTTVDVGARRGGRLPTPVMVQWRPVY